MFTRSRIIELSKDLEILKENMVNLYLWGGNEFLYITKPTTETLQKYRFFVNNSLLVSLIGYLILPIYICYWLILHVTHSFIFWRYKNAQSNYTNPEILYVSHATISNPSQDLRDRIYGDLINLNLYDFKKQIIYLNHLKSRKEISKKSKILSEASSVLCSKSLNPIHTLYIYLKFIYLFIEEFPTILKLQKNVKHTNLILGAVYFIFSRTNLSNYILLENVKRIGLKNLKCLFITSEGHAYENLLSLFIQKTSKDVTVFRYQHTPLFKPILTERAVKNKSNVISLFSSKYAYYYELKNKHDYKKLNYLVGNSNTSEEVKFSRIGKYVLLTPEGLNMTIREFCKLASEILANTDLPVRLRLHPDVVLSNRNKLTLLKLCKHSRFTISTTDLHQDLANCKFLITKSSSVGVEALKYRIKPIVFSEDDYIDFVNPIFLFDKYFTQFNSSSKLIEYVKSCIKKPTNRKSIIYYKSFNKKSYQSAFANIY